MPATLEDLLALHDEPFVRAAYVLLLRREADVGGLRSYTQLLRQGATRARVLGALANSDEARLTGSTLDGLAAYIKREDVPESGRLANAFARVGRWLNRHQAAQLRAIENNLAAVAYAVDEQLSEVRRLAANGPRAYTDEAPARPGVPPGAELGAIAASDGLSPEASMAALRLATALRRPA